MTTWDEDKQKVLDYIRDHPGSSSGMISYACRLPFVLVLALCRELDEEKKTISVELPGG